MASATSTASRYRRLRGAAERSAESFARHDMAVYAMALAYRGLFALFPFAVFLVAVVSFLRVDDVLEWLAQRQSRQQAGWDALLADWVRPALIAGVGLAAFQQFVGINTII